MIRNFRLPKTDHEARIVILGPNDVTDVLALQDITRFALPEAQKMFVLPQSVDYFTKFLEHKDGLMIGVRVDDLLIAQIVLMGPLTLEDAVARNAITRNDVPLHHAMFSDMVVIAKSMTVHPDWRGNELSQHLLAALLEYPIARTVDHVFAQISVDNVRSWELFVRNGFGIVAAGIDPADHKARFVLQRPVLGFNLHETASVDNIDPSTGFSLIMRLTGLEALVGRFDEHGPGVRLAFHAPTNAAASWSEEKTEVAG